MSTRKLYCCSEQFIMARQKKLKALFRNILEYRIFQKDCKDFGGALLFYIRQDLNYKMFQKYVITTEAANQRCS